MARIAYLTASFLVLLAPAARAQTDGDNPRLKPTLKDSELRSLNTKAKKWIAAELKWDEDPKQRKSRDRERGKFMTELEKRSKKEDLLKNMGDMLGVFDAVFPYKRQSTSGEIKFYKDPNFHLLAPKGYRPEEAYTSVLVLRGWDDAKKAWTDPKPYLDQSWKQFTGINETLIVIPEMRKGDDYDTMPDLTTDKGRNDETARIAGALAAFGETQRLYHLDRRRMFLDCGAGTCGFGMRLVTYFPSRFAGVILREPVDLGKLQLESLTGMPVFLVSTDKTKAACDKLQKALDQLQPGMVTIAQGTGDQPFANVAPEIDKWMKDKLRPLFPPEVSIAPNHDRFHKAFWAEMISCEPLEAVAEKDRPFLKVKADYEKNRIVVTSRSVAELGLYLNDALVDLDKPVTIIVNGKEIKGTKFQRSIRTVERYMRQAFDATALYTAYHRIEVPKVVKEKEEGK